MSKQQSISSFFKSGIVTSNEKEPDDTPDNSLIDDSEAASSCNDQDPLDIHPSLPPRTNHNMTLGDKMDPALYLDTSLKTISADERAIIINKGPCQPKESDIQGGFPKRKMGNYNRSFQEGWYNEWLEYSPSLDRMFCFGCRMFGTSKCDDQWVRNGLSNWKKGAQKIGEHCQSQCHITSMIKWQSYKSLQKPISSLLDDQKQKEMSLRAQRIEKNRQIILRIADVCTFLAKQNLAFRGHDESQDSKNKGNFKELIELLAKYDPILEDHLKTAPKNATYLCPEIQNDIIGILGELILRSIVKDVQESKFYSIMVDETTDASHLEQMSTCIRYVNSNVEVEERFIGFSLVSNTSAATLYDNIVATLQKLNIELKHMRGQCYDGASNMRGQFTGVQARFREINELALYVHCHGHILNLVLVDTISKNKMARDFFGVIEGVYSFITGSSKRQNTFLKNQRKRGIIPELRLHKLSDTRWACRYDGIKAIRKTFPTLIDTLEEIRDYASEKKHSAEAMGYLNYFQSFEAVLLTEILYDILGCTKILSDTLQGENIDFSTVLDLVSSNEKILTEKRTDQAFHEFYETAKNKCAEYEIDVPSHPSKRRRTVSSLLDTNSKNQHHFDSLEIHYRVQFYYEILDHLILEFKNRFNENSKGVLKNMWALSPKHFCSKEFDSVKQIANSSIQELANFYKSDVDVEKVLNEYKVFTATAQVEKNVHARDKVFKDCKSIIEVTQLMHSKGYHVTLPELFRLYKILITIPVTSCSSERSFSKLKLIKSYLRSTMTQERLSSLAIISLERDLLKELDANTVVAMFAPKRRLELVL